MGMQVLDLEFRHQTTKSLHNLPKLRLVARRSRDGCEKAGRPWEAPTGGNRQFRSDIRSKGVSVHGFHKDWLVHGLDSVGGEGVGRQQRLIHVFSSTLNLRISHYVYVKLT